MGVEMKLIENLFGEFIDCIMGIDPLAEPGIQYTLIDGHLIGGHSIGFWLFIGTICAGMIACIFSKKFRSKFF